MKRLVLLALALVIVAAAPNVKHLQLTKAEMESEFPSIVWNGTQLGLAWMDGRDGNQEIYFRTADVETGTLGPEPRLTSSETWDDNPELAWTGSEFAISWIHESKTKFDLMFQRIDPSGKPKGPAKPLIRQAMLEKNTAVCWTGAGFGVVAAEFRGGPGQADLTYRFLDDAGNPQGAATALATAPGIKVPAALLRNGSDFALIYQNMTTATVHLLRINPFGAPAGAATTVNLPGASCGMPAAANNGSTMIVAWPQKAADGSQVIVTILGSGGEVISVPTPVTTPGPSRPAVAVAATRDGFAVSWIEITDEGRTLFYQALDLTGKPIDAPLRLSKPRPIKVMGNSLAMATDPVGYVIAWVDMIPPMNTEIILSRIGFVAAPPAPVAPAPAAAAPTPVAPVPAAPVPAAPAPAAPAPAPVPAPDPTVAPVPAPSPGPVPAP